MKTKIMLLITFSSLILCCRSKNKITTTYKEHKNETEKIKVDSFSSQSSRLVHNKFTDFLLAEKINETSGEIMISGKSDILNPFVFHNVVGKDTVQSISITGNADYSINNHYTRTDNKKSEVKREKSANSIQDLIQKAVSKETIKETALVVSQETKKIKVNGFEITAWIFVTVIGITLILIFFTYKYFKK